jgi:hypothetical protein
VICLNSVDEKARYFLVETNQNSKERDKLDWTRSQITKVAKLKDDTKTFFIEQYSNGYIFSTDIINL